jgi:hypothetical protein
MTSSWRLADDLLSKLRLAFDCQHIPLWIDSTPDVSGDRAEEVQVWITEHGPCVGVVIDDDYDGFEKTEIRCVQTSVDHGLTADLASEVIRAFDSK